MVNSLAEMIYAPYFPKVGLIPAPDGQNPRHCGCYYRVDPKIGRGYSWVYTVGNLYAVAVYDMALHRSVEIEFRQPRFITIGSCGSGAASMMLSADVKAPATLLGYVGVPGSSFWDFPDNRRLHAVSLSMLPDFYGKRLAERFPDGFKGADLERILSAMRCGVLFPELDAALSRLRDFIPPPGLAAMYYESVVMEIVSLLVQWQCRRDCNCAERRVDDWKRDRMADVAEYLERNCRERPSLECLTRVACMSRNRLAETFRDVYGVGIAQYRRGVCVSRAKQLLRDSDLEIGKISAEVGYPLHGSFSEMFKQATGMTPGEYRGTEG
ncbi:MAG: AraC family transcriptional regulator [Oscillospiraceae bacterium]|nr:AraC family transcriptional regulator [Oscillospiraceae bacterium]